MFADPAAAAGSCRDRADAQERGGLFDGVSGRLDPSIWTKVHANWGGETPYGDYSGGVVLSNVEERDHVLVLHGRGNAYTGPVRGYDSDGTQRVDGRRTGAAIMSRQSFLGGRFEARVTIPPELGVVSAFWTYNNFKTDDGVEHNHEIDIEFPGRRVENAPPSLDYVALTTWVGLKPGQSTTAYKALPKSVADGNFHVLRFDWRPPRKSAKGAVSFYIDGKKLGTTTKNVPTEPGNLWLGLWFPPKWAGVPEFDSVEMKIDWVCASPLD